MLAKYGDKKYYLKYVEGKINKIKVEVEYTVVKGGIEAMGFCSSNYTKRIIKREFVEIILLKTNLDFSDKQIMIMFKNLIEKEGYEKAREKFDINTFNEREIMLGIQDRKRVEEQEENKKKTKKRETGVRKFLKTPENKSDLKAYILDKRLAGNFYTSIIESIKKDYKMTISKTTVMKLFKESCEEEGIEYFTDSDVFYMHKSEVARWIRAGLPRAEVMDRFKEEYGVELNKYYYTVARREAIEC